MIWLHLITVNFNIHSRVFECTYVFMPYLFMVPLSLQYESMKISFWVMRFLFLPGLRLLHAFLQFALPFFIRVIHIQILQVLNRENCTEIKFCWISIKTFDTFREKNVWLNKIKFPWCTYSINFTGMCSGDRVGMSYEFWILI